jgi:hypothetical protein
VLLKPLLADPGISLQPATRPITQEQLVNEVKGIYAGLVMVEKKNTAILVWTKGILNAD